MLISRDEWRVGYGCSGSVKPKHIPELFSYPTALVARRPEAQPRDTRLRHCQL